VSRRSAPPLSAPRSQVVADIVESQRPSGLVPDISPEYTVFAGGFRDSPEWGSAFIFLAEVGATALRRPLLTTPQELWARYDDDSALANFDAMDRYVRYLLTKASPPFVLAYGLGDWCDANSGASGDCSPPGQLTRLGVTGAAARLSSHPRQRTH
jgi:alpha-L-rhamnosidase